jgi:hypothetical protein
MRLSRTVAQYSSLLGCNAVRNGRTDVDISKKRSSFTLRVRRSTGRNGQNTWISVFDLFYDNSVHLQFTEDYKMLFYSLLFNHHHQQQQHHAVLTAGPQTFPMHFLQNARSSASASNFQYLLVFLRSSISHLRLLPRLPVPYIFTKRLCACKCYLRTTAIHSCRVETNSLGERRKRDSPLHYILHM